MKKTLLSLVLFGALATATAYALPNRTTAWPANVDTTYSSLQFRMNKWVGEGSVPQAEKAAVNGKFERFSVALSKKVPDLKTVQDLQDLRGSIEIALDSVKTGLDIRDRNIQEAYFEAPIFKHATFEIRRLEVPGSGVLQLGKTYEVQLDGTLDLHGMRKDFNGLQLAVTPLGHGIVLENRTPFSVASKDFGMDAQVAALLARCGHKGIDEAASLSMKLLLRR